MKLVKTISGYIAYAASIEELTVLGGLGICDFCSEIVETGFLVPVLNEWLCPTCFEEWNGRAKFYPEDLEEEKRIAKYYESKIPLEEADPIPILRGANDVQ